MVLVVWGWSREPGGVETGKWASDPEWAQNGGSKIAPPPIFMDLGSVAHGPKMGGAKSTPQVGPLGVSCPL